MHHRATRGGVTATTTTSTGGIVLLPIAQATDDDHTSKLGRKTSRHHRKAGGKCTPLGRTIGQALLLMIVIGCVYYWVGTPLFGSGGKQHAQEHPPDTHNGMHGTVQQQVEQQRPEEELYWSLAEKVNSDAEHSEVMDAAEEVLPQGAAKHSEKVFAIAVQSHNGEEKASSHGEKASSSHHVEHSVEHPSKHLLPPGGTVKYHHDADRVFSHAGQSAEHSGRHLNHEELKELVGLGVEEEHHNKAGHHHEAREFIGLREGHRHPQERHHKAKEYLKEKHHMAGHHEDLQAMGFEMEHHQKAGHHDEEHATELTPRHEEKKTRHERARTPVKT